MENNPTPPRPLIRKIFISRNEPRLRAGWRLLIQTILIFLTGVFIVIPLSLLLRLIQPTITPTLELIINGSIALVSITASVFLSRRFIDRRTFVSLGLKIDRNAIEDVLAGFLIPALMMALIFLLERTFGWTEYIGILTEPTPLETARVILVSGLVPFIIVGWQEELLSRGYHLQNLEDGINLPWAVVLSSVVFGAIHLNNPNSEQFIMVILGTSLGGVFFAFAYIRTRQLWLPIGLHIGWNFFEGPIFGFPVSGLQADGLFLHEVNGPEWITGGAFGPEAGVILLPALLLGVALVYYVTKDRKVEKIDGRISPPDGNYSETNFEDSLIVDTEINRSDPNMPVQADDNFGNTA
jgi:membrane protease YdiL (CAAX protease family)